MLGCPCRIDFSRAACRDTSAIGKSTSASRTLQTPNLPVGREFNYTLKVEVVRDGKAVTESKQITVRAGQVTPVNFDSTLLTVASN